MKNDIHFYLPEVRGKNVIDGLRCILGHGLKVFIMHTPSPFADILLFQLFQMPHSSQGLSLPQKTNHSEFLSLPKLFRSLFPLLSHFHFSALVSIIVIGGARGIKKKAQTLEVSRLDCVTHTSSPSLSLSLLVFKLGVTVPVLQGCHEN